MSLVSSTCEIISPKKDTFSFSSCLLHIRILQILVYSLIHKMWYVAQFWYHLYNLKNIKNIHGGMLQPATLLKVSLLHGCFSRILNCINGTKSRNASQMIQIFHGFANFNLLKLFNSFLANVRIFYPLKTAEKQEFFLCFQEVWNENIGQKWVREVRDKSLRDTSQLLYILNSTEII